jgi:branched-chain amino acid transport system substrate-binding protein
MAKEFVAWYADKYKDYPNWEADRAYFALASYKEAVERAAKAKGGNWPATADVIAAMENNLSVESLGGKGSWRKDHIADQTFVQGFSSHNNKYDFVTLDPVKIETMYSADLQKPAGANFWDWLKSEQFKI